MNALDMTLIASVIATLIVLLKESAMRRSLESELSGILREYKLAIEDDRSRLCTLEAGQGIEYSEPRPVLARHSNDNGNATANTRRGNMQ